MQKKLYHEIIQGHDFTVTTTPNSCVVDDRAYFPPQMVNAKLVVSGRE
jgi:hypothetical protein